MQPLSRRSLRFAAIALIYSAMLTGASGCATMETVAAQPGATFDLPLGKTAVVTGTVAQLLVTRG